MQTNKKRQSGIISGILLPMGLICLFAFCSLALALMGGSAYKQIQAGIDDSFGSTVTANYLRTKILQNNNAGAITLRDSGNGDKMLVIASEHGGYEYETRIYIHNGVLMESMVTVDTPHVPGDAYSMAIAHVSECTFTITDDGLFLAEIKSQAGKSTRTALALPNGGAQ